MVNDGKIGQLIMQKRSFLRQATKDYSAGGNDMLDDVGVLLEEAKAEITHNLELASCVRESDGETVWRKECVSLFMAWFEKWFGEA